MKKRSSRLLGETEITVPSPGNESVPYTVSATLNEDNEITFVRSNRNLRNQELKPTEREKDTLKISKVSIIGAGTMGLSVAAFLLARGFFVGIKTARPQKYTEMKEKITSEVSKSKPPEEVREAEHRLSLISSYKEFKPDLVIECGKEEVQVKRALFSEVDFPCILATNTSAIPIKELSKFVPDKAKFIGIHFFNPIDKMRLVEIIPSDKTSKETVLAARRFCEIIGKTPLIVSDRAGFVANRIMAAGINEAANLVEAGELPEKIDKAAELGLNYPIGPLKLADSVGLDIVLGIMRELEREGNFSPAGIIQKKVSSGKLGKKTKEGFYKY
ncbi:MAG: 3-hydroxyacyl-CoA dehydrogenase family protein [archaeon]